jgi:hypothetical protein
MFQHGVDLAAPIPSRFYELKWHSLLEQILVFIPEICLNLSWNKFLEAV